MATLRGLVGAAAALAVLSGCGGKPAGRVSGRVSHKGRPVTAAEVHFYSKEKGVGAVAKIDRSGGYTLAAPLEAGTYAVSVRPAPSEPGPPGSRPTRPTLAVPARYRDPGTSGLLVTVRPGSNEVPIDLPD